MDIEGTTFGTITIDGKTYDHDVIIRQPTAYLCPKAEDGNRRKNVLQRARQRSG